MKKSNQIIDLLKARVDDGKSNTNKRKARNLRRFPEFAAFSGPKVKVLTDQRRVAHESKRGLKKRDQPDGDLYDAIKLQAKNESAKKSLQQAIDLLKANRGEKLAGVTMPGLREDLRVKRDQKDHPEKTLLEVNSARKEKHREINRESRKVRQERAESEQRGHGTQKYRFTDFDDWSGQSKTKRTQPYKHAREGNPYEAAKKAEKKRVFRGYGNED